MVDDNKNSYSGSTGSTDTDTKLKGATIEQNKNDVAIKDGRDGQMFVQDVAERTQKKSETNDVTEPAKEVAAHSRNKEQSISDEQNLKQAVINKSIDETSLKLAVEQLKFLDSQGIKVHDNSVLANDIKNLATNAPEKAKDLGIKPETYLA